MHVTEATLTVALLAARGAVIPVSWETAFAVTTSSPRATWTAVGERMAGGPHGSQPTVTPLTAQTAGETRVALLTLVTQSSSDSRLAVTHSCPVIA